MMIDEVSTFLRERLCVSSFPIISFRNYSLVRKWTLGLSEFNIKPAQELIAIIRVFGTVQKGTTTNFLKNLLLVENSIKIKAVVIRIHCAGGDLISCPVIWKQIRTLAAKKPVIASLSDVAASAGYYMVIAANVIVAENLSLTGSISGRSSVNHNLQFCYENINQELVVSMAKHHARLLDSYGPGDAKSMAMMGNEIYLQFLAHAALSRSIPIDKVDEVARGIV